MCVCWGGTEAIQGEMEGVRQTGIFVVMVLACQAKWALIGGVFGPTQPGFSTHTERETDKGLERWLGKWVRTDSALEWRHTLSLPPGSGPASSHSFCFVFGQFVLCSVARCVSASQSSSTHQKVQSVTVTDTKEEKLNFTSHKALKRLGQQCKS